MSTSSPAFLAFELKWNVGARTAAIIVNTAVRFVSDIRLTSGGLRVNAKSVMEILLVAVRPTLPDGSPALGPHEGQRCLLSVDGPDAAAALEAMTDLFTRGERVYECRDSACRASAILIGLNDRLIDYACSKGHRWAVERGPILKPRADSNLS